VGQGEGEEGGIRAHRTLSLVRYFTSHDSYRVWGVLVLKCIFSVDSLSSRCRRRRVLISLAAISVSGTVMDGSWAIWV
jgi:hypothetical protein